jgi:acyl carrier protein
MTKTEAFDKIKTIVKPYVKNQAAFDSATDETSFLKDLQINSARLVDIILDMETEFDMTVTDEEADTIRTLGSAADLVVLKTSA